MKFIMFAWIPLIPNGLSATFAGANGEVPLLLEKAGQRTAEYETNFLPGAVSGVHIH